jgi:hypothetical protein
MFASSLPIAAISHREKRRNVGFAQTNCGGAAVRVCNRDILAAISLPRSGPGHHVIGQEFSARFRRIHDSLADQITQRLGGAAAERDRRAPRRANRASNSARMLSTDLAGSTFETAQANQDHLV